MDDVALAKLILSRTGNEKFNVRAEFSNPSKHLFTIKEECPACGLRHEGEIRAYIDREHQDWGYYISCPITNCKVFMRRK